MAQTVFRAGFQNDVKLYTLPTGARRLLLMFNYGYGVMDLSNPAVPSALTYEDMRSDIPPRGDGQNYVTSMGVAPDGQRAVFSLASQANPFQAAVGAVIGASQTFFLKGDFPGSLATGGAAVQKTGDGRYFAYVLRNTLMAANITTLPTGTLTAGSIQAESSAFPSGSAGTLQLTGNYLSYLSGGSVLILNVASPGSSPPNITTGFNETTLSIADFGRSSGFPISLATALDPAVPSALYVLVEFAGSGYSLVRVQGSTKTLIGRFDIPSAAGETWGSAYTSALITGGSNVHVLMWANRTAPSQLYRLYSTTVSCFGSTPGAIDFDPAAYRSFSLSYPMRGFADGNGNVYAYLATSLSAWALAFTCTANAPPPAPAAGSNGPVCAGGTLALTASTIENATYVWTGPNGFTSVSQNPSIPNVTPAAGGVYSVTATVNGCTSLAGLTAAVVNGASAAIAAPSQICLAAGNIGTASVPNAGIGATYAWTIVNGAITGGQGTAAVAFSVTGTGTTTLGVTVTTAEGCASTSSAPIPVQAQCGGFSTLTPCRAVDTRNVSGPLGGPPFQANGVRSFDLLQSICGVPPTAKAVSANLTVVSPTAIGALHAYPGDLGAAPLATAISFSSGTTRANSAILLLATDGSGTVTILNDSGGALDLIIDINGYFE